MDKKTADELARVVSLYADHPNTLGCEGIVSRNVAVPGYDEPDFAVIVVPTGARYDEVPHRLPLTTRLICTCVAPYCTSGKVAPALLDIVRGGGRVPA